VVGLIVGVGFVCCAGWVFELGMGGIGFVWKYGVVGRRGNCPDYSSFCAGALDGAVWHCLAYGSRRVMGAGVVAKRAICRALGRCGTGVGLSAHSGSSVYGRVVALWLRVWRTGRGKGGEFDWK